MLITSYYWDRTISKLKFNLWYYASFSLGLRVSKFDSIFFELFTNLSNILKQKIVSTCYTILDGMSYTIRRFETYILIWQRESNSFIFVGTKVPLTWVPRALERDRTRWDTSLKRRNVGAGKSYGHVHVLSESQVRNPMEVVISGSRRGNAAIIGERRESRTRM